MVSSNAWWKKGHPTTETPQEASSRHYSSIHLQPLFPIFTHRVWVSHQWQSIRANFSHYQVASLSTTAHPHYIYTHILTATTKLECLVYLLYVFGMWEEIGTPGGNPHKEREDMQTSHRRHLSQEVNQGTFCCGVYKTVCTFQWLNIQKHVCMSTMHHAVLGIKQQNLSPV